MLFILNSDVDVYYASASVGATEIREKGEGISEAIGRLVALHQDVFGVTMKYGHPELRLQHSNET